MADVIPPRFVPRRLPQFTEEQTNIPHKRLSPLSAFCLAKKRGGSEANIQHQRCEVNLTGFTLSTILAGRRNVFWLKSQWRIDLVLEVNPVRVYHHP